MQQKIRTTYDHYNSLGKWKILGYIVANSNIKKLVSHCNVKAICLSLYHVIMENFHGIMLTIK